MTHRGCGCCANPETCAEKSWAFTDGAAFNDTDWDVADDPANVSYVSSGVIEVTDDTLTPNSTQANEAFQLILAFSGVDSGSSLTIRMDNAPLADQTLTVDPFANTMQLNSRTVVDWGAPQSATDWVTVSMGFNTARTWGYVSFGTMLHPWYAKAHSVYQNPSPFHSKYQNLYCYDEDGNANFGPNFEIEVVGTLQLRDYLGDTAKGVRQVANTHTFSGGVPVLACPYVLPTGGNYATADRMPASDDLTLTGYDHTPPGSVTDYDMIWSGGTLGYGPAAVVPIEDQLTKSPGGNWDSYRGYINNDDNDGSSPSAINRIFQGMYAYWTDDIHEQTSTSGTPYPAFQQRQVLTLEDLAVACGGYIGSTTSDRNLVNAGDASTISTTLTRPGSCRGGQSSTIQWSI